jgi:transposase
MILKTYRVPSRLFQNWPAWRDRDTSSLIDNCGVAKGYVRLRRDEAMLLAPDVRDWLPADHVVWFLIDAVAALDTSVLHRRARLGGAGRAPYDPDMLLVVLLYAYAGGLRSSRKIERRCREDVAFMVASGLCYPDHVTIARFRKGNDAAVEDLFVQVLRLCGRAGMGSLEHVAIDGTKIAADASRARSRDADGLRGTARRLLDEAAATDEAEDARYGTARGDELPEQLRDPARRRQVIDDLLAQAGRDPDRTRGRRRARKAEQASQALALLDEAEAEAGQDAQTGVAPAIARLGRAEASPATAARPGQAAADDRARREAAAAARTHPARHPPGPLEQHARVRHAVARLERTASASPSNRPLPPSTRTPPANATSPTPTAGSCPSQAAGSSSATTPNSPSAPITSSSLSTSSKTPATCSNSSPCSTASSTPSPS